MMAAIKYLTLKSIKTFFATYLLANLFVCVLKCDTQKGPLINQQQLMNAVSQMKQFNNLRQPYHESNITLSRPLDRPNLPENKASISNNSDSEPALDASKLTLNGEDLMFEEGRNLATFSDLGGKNQKKTKSKQRKNNVNRSSNKTLFDDEQSADSSDSNEIFDEIDESAGFAGTQKEPDCAAHGRYYCTYKEEYPLKLVTEVTKYYKWPLEKLFRDLHAQIMPKLAQDSNGNLVCDSITRVVRPGWARNTNERWLVVINNDNYHQYVTEVICQYGSNSRCNFIPPCYYSSCQQRYNTQKLLVIDPSNPYRGPFMSEFLFPSCCVCYVPSASDNFQDKYRSSPATIYQRTMQQESANNLYPPKFRPPGLLEDVPSSLVDSSIASSSGTSSSTSSANAKQANENQAAGPGEIRREGDQYKQLESANGGQKRDTDSLSDFPRL